MAEYTYADVIIDPNDPRVEIGKEYYFGENPASVISRARRDAKDYKGTLTMIHEDWDDPFLDDGAFRYPCIIRKKDPEKKYVPFDLFNEEDREKLRCAWVRIKGIPTIEYQVVGLNVKYVLLGNADNLETDDLLRSYEFVDGSPCGKLVEVEE